MLKWFAYIVMLLIFAPCLSSAGKAKPVIYTREFLDDKLPYSTALIDTLTKKQKQEEEKNTIKEIQKAKRQAKPEKINEDGIELDITIPVKPKRQRRPEGMERPPEIPRRNE